MVNYSGVTVGAKRGEYRYKGYRFVITDLPGTYALSAYTPEELYVRRHLVSDTPDVVVNAVVASNEAAIHLYEDLGFTRVGTIPGGFCSILGNFEDMHIYYKDCFGAALPS